MINSRSSLGLAALMFNALAARCVWHCGVLLRLLLAAPLLVLACGHALRSSQALAACHQKRFVNASALVPLY